MVSATNTNTDFQHFFLTPSHGIARNWVAWGSVTWFRLVWTGSAYILSQTLYDTGNLLVQYGMRLYRLVLLILFVLLKYSRVHAP